MKINFNNILSIAILILAVIIVLQRINSFVEKIKEAFPTKSLFFLPILFL